MTPVSADHAAIELSLQEMLDLVDNGRAGESIRFLADEFTMAVNSRVFRRGEYAELMHQRTNSESEVTHRASGIRICMESDDTARVEYVVEARRKGAGDFVVLIGDFNDRWVRSDGEWKLHTRGLAMALRTSP
jgi:hypothetical protein